MPGNLMTNTPPRDIGYNVVQAICGRITGAGADCQRQGRHAAGRLHHHRPLPPTWKPRSAAPRRCSTSARRPPGRRLASAVALTAGSLNTVPVAALVQPLAADTDVYASITAGGATTAGDAYVIVTFVKPLT